MSTPESSIGARKGVNGQAVIPAVCSTHEAGAIDLVVRRLPDGLIALGPHGAGGCVLTVHAAALFDLLGAGLG
ncbi:MAG: hypothetical protein JO115_16540 [Pseudonocardiales bacterium]|nr:hypothetical protein [Pseudonocardiales bacterium]